MWNRNNFFFTEQWSLSEFLRIANMQNLKMPRFHIFDEWKMKWHIQIPSWDLHLCNTVFISLKTWKSLLLYYEKKKNNNQKLKIWSQFLSQFMHYLKLMNLEYFSLFFSPYHIKTQNYELLWEYIDNVDKITWKKMQILLSVSQ